MPVTCKTVHDARLAFQSCKTPAYYDAWAETYEEDHTLMSFRAPHLAVDFLSQHFCGRPEDTQVLDVACGTGWVAKLMTELGFRSFVGVDGSKGMLELAAKTGLYQDLKLALLGTEALPAQTGVFDVVLIVGALYPGFVPVSTIRELCHAAKPGGLVCIARGNYQRPAHLDYNDDMHTEMKLMEEEGLWSLVGTKQSDRYLADPRSKCDGDGDEQYISGTVYLYRKCV